MALTPHFAQIEGALRRQSLGDLAVLAKCLHEARVFCLAGLLILADARDAAAAGRQGEAQELETAAKLSFDSAAEYVARFGLTLLPVTVWRPPNTFRWLIGQVAELLTSLGKAVNAKRGERPAEAASWEQIAKEALNSASHLLSLVEGDAAYRPADATVH